MKTVNPHNHQYPHAKIDNVQLTSISRLRKSPERRLPMVGDPKEHPRDPYYSNRHGAKFTHGRCATSTALTDVRRLREYLRSGLFTW